MFDQSIPSAAEFPYRLEVRSARDTQTLGARAADLLAGGEVLLLYGPLGGGKTCFVQGLCAGLEVVDEVTSPTFTLVNRYTGRVVVYHVDLYRIQPGDDLNDIGLEEILDEVATGEAVMVAEWPEPLVPLVTRRLELLALPTTQPDTRIWHLRGRPELPDAWRSLLI